MFVRAHAYYLCLMAYSFVALLASADFLLFATKSTLSHAVQKRVCFRMLVFLGSAEPGSTAGQAESHTYLTVETRRARTGWQPKWDAWAGFPKGRVVRKIDIETRVDRNER